jgi:catechol 2,3-dioxygenase-like lactoylglutathione lyase family enzyme
MQIARLDHLVLTVADIAKTCDFYTKVLGMEVVQFGEGRTALRFGQQKINLHPADNIPGLVADKPTAGSGDLCFHHRDADRRGRDASRGVRRADHRRPRPARRRDRHDHLGLYPRSRPEFGRDFELLDGPAG